MGNAEGNNNVKDINTPFEEKYEMSFEQLKKLLLIIKNCPRNSVYFNLDFYHEHVKLQNRIKSLFNNVYPDMIINNIDKLINNRHLKQFTINVNIQLISELRELFKECVLNFAPENINPVYNGQKYFIYDKNFYVNFVINEEIIWIKPLFPIRNNEVFIYEEKELEDFAFTIKSIDFSSSSLLPKFIYLIN